MNRASAAQGHPAAEFGSGQGGNFADGPQQGHVGVGIQSCGIAIEDERCGHKRLRTVDLKDSTKIRTGVLR
jgi:hypothetical protein